MPWQTAHTDHAIERVAVSFILAEPLPSRPWSSVAEEAAKIAAAENFVGSPMPSELPLPIPGVRAKQIFQISIGPGGAQVTPAADGPLNSQYSKTTDDGLFEQFSISRGQYTYVATRYSGWDSFRDRAQTLVGEFLARALEFVSLQSVKLEYWDRFVLHGDDPVDYGGIFREGSRIVPPFGLETQELWHSHSGYFTAVEGAQRRLINVNLDMLDLAQPDPQMNIAVTRRSAGIYSMAQDHFAPDVSAADALAHLESMHTDLKAILADIVNDEVIERIGLNLRQNT